LWCDPLLDAGEQEAFRRFAVFADGADVDAAEAVTGTPVAVLDALVAKSLVTVRHRRLRQLEVVRQFAAAVLARSPDVDGLRGRHAEHYLALVERLGPQVRVRGRGPAFDAIELDLANLRAAAGHYVAGGDGERALRLNAALEPYWTTTWNSREGADLLESALTLEDAASDRTRGRARIARSILLRAIRMEESVEDAQRALELCTAADDLEGRCMALDMVTAHASYFSDLEQAQACAREERALAERLGDPYHLAIAVMRQAWAGEDFRAVRAFADEAIPLLRRCGHVRGIVEITPALVRPALEEGEYEAAAVAGEEGLRAAEQTGEPMALAFGLGNAGLPALFLERIDDAERLFQRQSEIVRRERIDLLWLEVATGLACVAAHRGEAERAATFMGFREAMPIVVPEADGDQRVREQLIARFVTPARGALGERAWARAAAAGAAMTPDELCAFMLTTARAVRR
jgi:hypothetical protein